MAMGLIMARCSRSMRTTSRRASGGTAKASGQGAGMRNSCARQIGAHDFFFMPPHPPTPIPQIFQKN